MNLAAHTALVRRLKDELPRTPTTTGAVPAERFTSPARFALERERLFARVPVVVATEAELAGAGACTVVDVAGISAILARGHDGVLRGFKNACRHRGTELVTLQASSSSSSSSSSSPACQRKAFVCPYHSWTYDLGGKLTHVPHPEAFRGAHEGRDLAPIHVAGKGGIVLASLAPFDVDAHLGALAADLDVLDTARPAACCFRSTVREVRANWKLIVDAFLDAYHIRHLHRETVARFFLDAEVEAEPLEGAGGAVHIRAVTARKTLREASAAAVASGAVDVRQVATPSWLLFPSTILIAHPDYTSVMRIEPVAADVTRFHHAMLTPAPPKDDAERSHFDKSFTLIDEGVFAREDLVVVEKIQRGLATGATPSVLYGELEQASLWFHASVDAAVDTAVDAVSSPGVCAVLR